MEAINQRKAHRIAEMIRRDISELRKSGTDIGKEANEVFDMIDDLAVELLTSTPPRNCDALTADERAHKFIEKWEKAHGETIDGKTIIYLSSFSRWLQLPRESEEAR